MTVPLLNPALAMVPAYVTAGKQSFPSVCLASNENPYGASPRVQAALQAALGDVHRYPDPSADWLRQRIARHYGVSADTVMVGNGATELLDLIARATLGPGQNSVYAVPSFVMYRIASLSMGAEIREVGLAADGSFDLDAILARVDAQTKLVYLANPNNPTGTYIDAASLRRFAERLPAHVVLVLDEAYAEYAVAPDFPDGLDLLAVRERMVVVRTFSKCHGLAGLRVGYLFASTPVIGCLERARLPFNVNALAQTAAAAALEDTEYIARCRRANRAEMARLAPELRARGYTVTPSQTNFLLVDFADEDMVHALARRGVMVRSMAPYGLPTHARISIGTRLDSRALLEALDHVFAEVRRRPAA